MVPAYSGPRLESTGVGLREKRWQHILALCCDRNGPHRS